MQDVSSTYTITTRLYFQSDYRFHAPLQREKMANDLLITDGDSKDRPGIPRNAVPLTMSVLPVTGLKCLAHGAA